MIDLQNPILLGPVQNQEHYMNGVVARRNHFVEPILGFLEDSCAEFADLTGRHYGLVSSYRCEDADTVFLSLGSAAENIEAAVDYLRETRQAAVGSIHLNVLRPFPEAAVVEALREKERVIILERTDEPLAGANPLERDIRSALSKAVENSMRPAHAHLPALQPAQIPTLYSGVYGLGSRDFRPEGILGAYEFACEGRTRQDGRGARDGNSFFVLGIDHPYAVESEETPSLLPPGSIAVRFHSIGGWGMITTGKNLGAIIGQLGRYVAEQQDRRDEFGRIQNVVNVSANPKYGSEKKGAPTSYFLVAAHERVRVNCDLHHVNVVLCCDPKAFTHTNPLAGITEGGALVMESDESPERFWERVPVKYRQEIIDKKIRLFVLPGFDIARRATDRPDLQTRMQGNSFLGAFFSVSPFLEDYGIGYDHFQEVVRKQYESRFGKLGEAVVESNMQVMTQGYERCTPVACGKTGAADRSSMRGETLIPLSALAAQTPKTGGERRARRFEAPEGQPETAPLYKVETFDSEFRAGYGYTQPASAYAACGVMGAGTGETASKYVARRETPVFIAENCTQCMACIAACPDTALPNTAQDISTVLEAAARNYVSETADRKQLLELVPRMEVLARKSMLEDIEQQGRTPFVALVARALEQVNGSLSPLGKRQFLNILEKLPLAYSVSKPIFSIKEKKEPGSGGLFSIFVSDLCKGCAECVTECGDHEALRMVVETEEVNSEHNTAMAFFDLLPDTPSTYLGLYDDEHPEESKAAALRNHLMVRRNYEALVSGDGACAGCGEKSILRAIATVTESFMRPTFSRKADRLRQKAARLRESGAGGLEALQRHHPQQYENLRRGVAHLILGLGGETPEDTASRIQAHGEVRDEEMLEALAAVLDREAFNHDSFQALDGRLANGMSVMAMAAHTGCNTVYGSTPPNNPHPYPWMNSLFQDGATIGWMMGESFIDDHARRSVLPERLTDSWLSGQGLSEQQLYELTHFSDHLMTHQEILELPKVWVVGGDGGMGDIGFQNVSKVVLQNRPNVKLIMLDTQVYSNTGGQNSDSSPAPGGGDFNQFGQASQGKLVEKKCVSEILAAGHGSPYVAQVSMANASKLYKVILDALDYRGTAFLQCFTTCQPEHGVGDDMSTVQASRIRDSRGMPEFIFDPRLGETYQECFDVKGNPAVTRDWCENHHKPSKSHFKFTAAHWAFSEARFRRHFKRIQAADAARYTHLDNMLVRITQKDVIQHRHLNPEHRSYIPDFGVYMTAADNSGRLHHVLLSRQMVYFCVERRKAWRNLQSKAGVQNPEYAAQRALLHKVDSGEIPLDEFLQRSQELFLEEQAGSRSGPAPEPAAATAG